jgi:hypothetical protein
MSERHPNELTPAELAEWGALAEAQWRKAGAEESDIQLSRRNGIDARDNGAFRRFTAAQGLLIVVRCPKVSARAFHGVVPPKMMAVKTGSGADGIARASFKSKLVDGTTIVKEREYVSDYDLMSVWERRPGGLTKIFVSPIDKPPPVDPKELWRGKFSPRAHAIVIGLNKVLVSRIQHGCQDDWNSVNNRGVKADDHFTAFFHGHPHYLSSPAATASFYGLHHLYFVPAQKKTWPYDATGRFAPS